VFDEGLVSSEGCIVHVLHGHDHSDSLQSLLQLFPVCGELRGANWS
jgi:hypothetical protein